MASDTETEVHVTETTGNTIKLEIKWIFRNATSDWQSKKPGVGLTSPLYHAKGDEEVKWWIQIYPNGEAGGDEGYMSAFLCLEEAPANRSTLTTKYSLTLTDELGQKVSERVAPGQDFICQSDYSWGWAKFAKHCDILNKNMFCLVCKLEYTDCKTTTTTSIMPGPSMQLNDEEANSSLDRDLEQFFTDRSGTDVCFIVSGKEIKAHKAILSARSPVFKAMLKSGMKESASSRVEIKDIAPDIFEALLRFIYTDRVDLTKINTKDLLAAANKYLLPLLKFQCQKSLSERIKNENCVELLALADLHNAAHLKKSALNFVRQHRAEIMQTEGWKNLKQSRPDLAFLFDVFDSLV